MGIVELLIVVLLLLWLFGSFGRGRWYGGRGGTAVSDGGGLAGGNWVHTLLVIVVILVVLRLLGVL
jgi:TM2 domain-containing membrane protein YozV